jgi:hypothetical protein
MMVFPAPPECIIIPPKQCVQGSWDPLVAMVSRQRISVAAQWRNTVATATFLAI